MRKILGLSLVCATSIACGGIEGDELAEDRDSVITSLPSRSLVTAPFWGTAYAAGGPIGRVITFSGFSSVSGGTILLQVEDPSGSGNYVTFDTATAATVASIPAGTYGSDSPAYYTWTRDAIIVPAGNKASWDRWPENGDAFVRASQIPSGGGKPQNLAVLEEQWQLDACMLGSPLTFLTSYNGCVGAPANGVRLKLHDID